MLPCQVDQAKKQIESLTADQDRVTRQLAQAQKRIAALQTKLNQSPAPAQPSSLIPTDPFAAPTSMLAELRRRFARQMSQYPRDS